MFSSLYRQFRCSTLTSRVSGSFSMFFNAIIRLKSNEGFLKEKNQLDSKVWPYVYEICGPIANTSDFGVTKFGTSSSPIV